jgi:hypothetical protein
MDLKIFRKIYSLAYGILFFVISISVLSINYETLRSSSETRDHREYRQR